MKSDKLEMLEEKISDFLGKGCRGKTDQKG